MNKNRILIKISGEALMGKSSNGIDVSTINFIAAEIKKVYKKLSSYVIETPIIKNSSYLDNLFNTNIFF